MNRTCTLPHNAQRREALIHHAERDGYHASPSVSAQQKTHGGLPWVVEPSSSHTQSTMARMSSSVMMRYSSPSMVTSLPAYEVKSTRSPSFTWKAARAPLSINLPSPR